MKRRTFFNKLVRRDVHLSVKEVEAVVHELGRAFNSNDTRAAAALLSENLEVFDHVPYRFDNKKQFVDFLTGAMASFKNLQFGFRQLSCRLINEGAAVANAYDTFLGLSTDGKAQMLHGRTTLVLAKETGQWKIVSARTFLHCRRHTAERPGVSLRRSGANPCNWAPGRGGADGTGPTGNLI